MNRSSIRLLHAAAAVLAALSVSAAPLEYAGRGVHHFASRSGCPLSPADRVCNRVALDRPDARARVDADAGVILIESVAGDPAAGDPAAGDPAAGAPVVADVLLHGSGLDAHGRRVPLNVQLILRRPGKRWNADIYARAPVRGVFTDVRIDPYRIDVREDGGERTLIDAARLRKLFAQPSLAARLGRHLVEVRPSDRKRPSPDDITIALGLGRVSKAVARARFAPDPAHAGDLQGGLERGTWAIELQALSRLIPKWVVRRELFLFGLEDRPLLQDARRDGFKAGDTLVIGARAGQGYLTFRGRSEPFAGAAASARLFLQDSFMGLILAAHPDAPAAPAR